MENLKNKSTSAGGVESKQSVTTPVVMADKVPAEIATSASVPLITKQDVVEIPPPVSKPTPKPVALGLNTPKTIRSIPVPEVPPVPELVPELVHVFVATFAIRDSNTGKVSTHIVEVPHTQNPVLDQKAAWREIQTRFPDVKSKDIRRTAGRPISRPGGQLPVIIIREGETIRQLFPDRSEFEAARTVGTVIFDGALCDVILRHLRAKSAFAVTLRQPGGTVVNFSEQITTNRLAGELPKIIAEIIGSPGQTLKLYFHRA